MSLHRPHLLGFPGVIAAKNPPVDAGDLGDAALIYGSGRSPRKWFPTPVLLPGKSHGWRSLVGCSAWSRYESDMTERFTFTFHFDSLEKEMATHSSVLAWRIPGMEEPCGLLFIGLQSRTRLKQLCSSSSSPRMD